METKVIEDLEWLIKNGSNRVGVFASWDSRFVLYVLPYLFCVWREREYQREPIAFEVP